MQKTKLGISAGLLSAAIYFIGLLGGFLVTVVLTGYVLLFEENEWLKKNAVKAVVLMVCFSLASAVIYLIPSAMSFLDNAFSIFGGFFRITFLTSLVNMVTIALDALEKILFIGLGLKALNQGSITLPIIDKLIDKYME